MSSKDNREPVTDFRPEHVRICAGRDYAYRRSIVLYMMGKGEDGTWSHGLIARPQWSQKAAEPREMAPLCRLEMEEAQALMDDLWAAGLRPSEGTGSAGALAATQKHLDDMRRLVFEHLCGGR